MKTDNCHIVIWGWIMEDEVERLDYVRD